MKTNDEAGALSLIKAAMSKPLQAAPDFLLRKGDMAGHEFHGNQYTDNAGNSVTIGDEVHWMSGGSWDGVIQNIDKLPSGNHNVSVQARHNGELVQLKPAEHYGLLRGRSKFYNSANKPA